MAAELHEQLAGETERLLQQRVRGGLWLLLLAALLFGAVQLRSAAGQALPLLAVKLVQVATIALAALALRHAFFRGRAVWVALAVAIEVCVTTAVSGILTDDAATTFLLAVVLTMGTATLLPWGSLPQITTVLTTTTTAFWNAHWVWGGLAPLESSAVAALIASATSVYVAWTLERNRIARRYAEELTRRGEARKGAILEAALDCIVTIDHRGRILEFNPAAERTFGHARDAVLGRALADVVIPPGLREAHRRGLETHLRTGVGVMLGRRIETMAIRADGSEFPVELAITRIASSGAPLFTGHLRDLSERRLAEEAQAATALVRVGRELTPVLDTTILLQRLCVLTTEILECDASRGYLWSPQAQGYLQVASAGEHNRPATSRVISGAAVAQVLTSLRHEGIAALSELDGVAREQGGLLVPPGALAWLLLPLVHDGELVGLHAAARTLSPRPFSPKEAELGRGMVQIASLALTNARLVEALEAASKVKSEFLSTMSHELRTPINGILGYTEMIADEAFDAFEREQFAARIRTVGRQLLDLVEGTLEIGRIEAGASEVRHESVWLPTFWNALAREWHDLPRSEGVALDWNLEVPELALRTDAHKLGIVLRNLVGNALKFTEEGGVKVSASLDGELLAIRVADTGPGIGVEDRSVVFEMFRQADGSDSRRHGGAGLGLYLVQRFVAQLGGVVELDSLPGSGSTFTVVLPLRSDEQREAEATLVPAPTAAAPTASAPADSF